MHGPRRAALVLAALVAALGLCAHASAQTATLSMTADRTELAVGDTLRLQIRSDTVGQDAPDATLPDLSAFETVSHQFSRPIQFSMGWGGQQPTVQATAIHTFILRATREGRFSLAPATVVVAGRTFRSNPLTIVVGPRTGAPPPPGTANVPPTTGVTPADVPRPPAADFDPARGADVFTYDDRAFLRTVVSNREPYVGEQVTITVFLYVRQQLSSWPTTTTEPTTDGFWTRDLLPPTRTPEPRMQEVQGVRFLAYVMRNVAAFPLAEGDVTYGPMGVTVSQSNPFDVFMGGGAPDLQRSSPPVTLHVRPLPTTGRPPGPVHVGTLTLESTLDRSQTPTGDAVTLTVRANGTGRVDGLSLPDLSVPGLRILAPQVDTAMQDTATQSGTVVGGTRTFEWLIVPEQPGTFTIPSFHVAAFDPRAGTFSDVASAPLTLTAAGNALVDPAAAPTTPAQDDTPEADETSTPLGPVRTDAALVRHRTHLASQSWYPWLLSFFPIAWLTLVLVRAARGRLAARDAALPAHAKVAREAKKRLATAEERAAAGDARGFYGALTLAISAVIEGKLGESVGALTHRELRDRLIARGMDAELAKKICAELEGADFARYSTSGAAATEMASALDRGRELLSALDRFVASVEDE